MGEGFRTVAGAQLPAVERAIERRVLRREDFERMNLPADLRSVCLQGVPEGVRALVERYLRKIREMRVRGIGLFLTGPAGVGKSGIGALIAKEARATGHSAYFTGVWELREALRSRVMWEDEISSMDRCREVDFLILDNLQEDEPRETYVNSRVLEELLAFRNLRKRVTVVTTQLELSLVIGRRICSVLEGAIVPLQVQGANKRATRHEEIVRAVYEGK